MEKTTLELQRTMLRHASARMLSRYTPWVDYMLTVTFGKANLRALPNADEARQQLRHLGAALNSKVWKNRRLFNDKCNILFLPVLEGFNTATRAHAHVLLGNVQNRQTVDEYMQQYIPKSEWLAPRYDLRDVYDADGIAWYVSKEVPRINADAIAWEIASIPKPLLP